MVLDPPAELEEPSLVLVRKVMVTCGVGNSLLNDEASRTVSCVDEVSEDIRRHKKTVFHKYRQGPHMHTTMQNGVMQNSLEDEERVTVITVSIIPFHVLNPVYMTNKYI